jgi:hypothetical protein
MFSGSYDSADVVFLLKPVHIEPTPVDVKERLIQSGQRHYSEMLSAERLPSPDYLRVFHQALARQQERFVRHVLSLAQLIASARSDPIVVVSLARAGTPVGVLVTRMLRALLHRHVQHYSVSIIRDRGIDRVALQYILARHGAESVCFVDGWTGKGVIANELREAISAFNEEHDEELDSGLNAVADLCGVAAAAATSEDYLIPSSVLGCTISGLISRSILNADLIGPGDFHGCVYYEEFVAHDLSRWFVDRLMGEAERVWISEGPPAIRAVTAAERVELASRNEGFLHTALRRYRLRSVHHIKPGIGESTRVLLRRVPDRLLLRDPDAGDVAHLLVLAEEKHVPIDIEPTLPYQAVALIREVAE